MMPIASAYSRPTQSDTVVTAVFSQKGLYGEGCFSKTMALVKVKTNYLIYVRAENIILTSSNRLP